MSSRELQFQVDQLNLQLDEQTRRHEDAVAKLRDEARDLRHRLQAAIDRNAGRKNKPGDTTFVRRIEWLVEEAQWRSTEKDSAVWSVEFSVLGIQGMQLEFFPHGRSSTLAPGVCSLFVWCPAGVRMKYQLFVGKHVYPPDEDEYRDRMGHGHSNFCSLEAQLDKQSGGVLVGVKILNICVREDPLPGLRLINQGPEAVVAREAARLRNFHANTVEWRIRGIKRRAQEVPRGLAICSPLFSIAGVREMLLEFYPNSTNAVTPSAGSTPTGSIPPVQEAREGYCGFYVRCASNESLMVTLFVGKAQKGPVKTVFDSCAAKGLPEFCRMEDALGKDEEDLVVGIVVHNSQQEEPHRTLYLGEQGERLEQQ